MIAWYIVPYEIDISKSAPGYPLKNCRRIAMCAYNQYIWTAQGKWHGIEVLGNRAIVKIKAPQAVLTTIDGVYKRIPKDNLDDSLADLPSGVKVALKNELIDMGYPITEIVERFGNDLGQHTLGNVLRFMARRRLIPRYDKQTDEVVFDLGTKNCQPLQDVENKIQE